MDKKLKAKWVKALRSGKYKQGEGMLHSGDAFCCLGVLCVQAGMSTNSIDGYTMPDSLKESMDLIDTHIAGQLADLNDEGVPFEVIAGLIQEAL